MNLDEVPYSIGDTVEYVCKDSYAHALYEGDKATVVDIQEGILDTPYVIVFTEEGRTVSCHYYRFKKVN